MSSRHSRATGVLASATLITGALVALPVSTAAAAGCPKSIVVTDGNQLAAAVGQVCPGGTVNIAATVTTIYDPYVTVAKAVKIRGAGPAVTTIWASRPFDVTSTGALTLSGVTLLGGTQWAVRVAGTLTASNIVVTDFFPVAIYALAGSTVKLGSGTVITGNGGGHYDWEGGPGIYNDGGKVTLNGDAAVTDNVNYGCNWIWIPSINRYMFPGGLGGGVFMKNNGTLTLNDHAVVSGNVIHYCDTSRGPAPTGSGGGIFASSGTVILNGSASVTGNGAGRGGGIAGGSTTTGLASAADIALNDTASVSGNLATFGGGGIYNWINGTLTMHNAATVAGNTGHDLGGGIYNGSGTVAMAGSALVTGNTVTAGAGGGVYNATLFSYPTGQLLLHDGAAVTGNSPDDVAP